MNKYLEKLQIQANQDPFLLDFIKPDPNRVPILHKDRPVGFYTPRKDNKYLRAGALYLDPEYRGRGIMNQTLSKYFAGNKGKAWISNSNTNSITLFTGLGFKPGSTREIDGEVGMWYIKE